MRRLLLAFHLLVLSLPLCTRSLPASDPKPAKPDRNHWGREVVGFDWLEEDSVDGRWQQTILGRWQACLVALPEGPVRKGLSIRVGEKQEATICYDTEYCTVRAAWTGGFLQFDPARYGLIGTPRPQGTLLFSTREAPGWVGAPVQYGGLSVHGERVVLQYTVDGVQFRESPWLETHGKGAAIVREIEIGPSTKALRLNLLPGLEDTPSPEQIANRPVVTVTDGDGELGIAVISSDGVVATADADGARVDIAPREDLRRMKLLYWRGLKTDRPAFDALIAATAEPAPIDPLLQPGPPHWTEEIVTQGGRAKDNSAYVIDTITLPFDNPYRALFFVGGHDFFSDGRVALCTAHGEVWTVSGVDDDLDRLVWKRYATGLFQALGVTIIDDSVYVLGRDQITRLHDRNGDGEADFYECFSNRHFTSSGGHDYVTCLETDSQGNFYFLHGKQGLLRLSPDGKMLDVISTGLRNPNGMGIGPGDVITVAPQEGEWTPASYVAVARQGRHFGYQGPQVTPERPLGYDPPLCWIPRAEDNSCGGQVWVANPDWGPLSGKMLHLSYGQCRPLLVLQEDVDGITQAGVVTLPLEFDSGIMRGRFSPHDGQLYLSGLRGWTTRAVNDGCLQRLRYTGLPAALPVSVQTWRNGLMLTFSQPLDPDSAQDPGNYSIEQWNYRYAAVYGSPDLKPSNPNEEGHDPVEVLSATLQPDGRTVFIETPPLAPVHQFAVTCRINTRSVPDASSVRDTGRIRMRFTHSMRAVPERTMDPASLMRRTPAGALPEEVTQTLQPGLLWRFVQAAGGRESRDARTGRLAALLVADGEPPTPFIPPGPFTATAEGYFTAELSGDFRFAFQGVGEAHLTINGRPVLRAAGDNLEQAASDYVPLHKGYNAIRIDYRTPPAGAARLRLLWLADPRDSGLTGNRPLEPLPPTVLSHRGGDPELTAASALRRGRELFVTSRCDQCHQAVPVDAQRALDAPHLGGVARRLTPEWIAAWLRDPQRLRNHTTMPAMLAGRSDAAQAQTAADLTVWLNAPANAGAETNEESPAIEGEAAAGESLWEDLGCIVCHHFRAPGAADEYDRTSLHFAAAKYTPQGLHEFLRQPHARYRWSRMPDFRLSPEEAAHLAAYIRKSASGRIEATPVQPGGNVDNGRKQFAALGCNNCHQVADPHAPLPTRPTVDLFAGDPARGCLSEGPRAGTPAFQFTADDRRALAAFLKSGRDSLERSVPVESAAQFVNRLRCTACHDRDATRSPRRIIVVEDGQKGIAPDNLPSLTWTGEKLYSDWTRRLLAGQLEERMRPWQPARMPAFPAYADVLATGLSAQHGLATDSAADFEPDTELVEQGRQLALPATLDCRQCHGVGPEQPRGDDRTRIALGINFAHVKERLRHDYYQRFVLDPPRYDINTRMPRLAATDGTTRIKSILNGDAQAQFEAVWHFIQSVPLDQQGAVQSSPVTP